ncbi:glyoxalase [Rhodobacterales bacterium 52_120_T64]|nr:glyoxalase [Rhodobacterales bacterium 52_120_T64]
MDYDNVKAAEFGASLKGMGINLLVRDVLGSSTFLRDVFAMKAFQVTKDFAILTYGDQVFQLHSDATFHSHPLLSLLPVAGPRGGGIELRLYETDPDQAVILAEAHVHDTTVLQPPTDKPHGLRECVILDADGYAWVPSRPLSR